jgi:hypothetical protein
MTDTALRRRRKLGTAKQSSLKSWENNEHTKQATAMTSTDLRQPPANSVSLRLRKGKLPPESGGPIDDDDYPVDAISIVENSSDDDASEYQFTSEDDESSFISNSLGRLPVSVKTAATRRQRLAKPVTHSHLWHQHSDAKSVDREALCAVGEGGKHSRNIGRDLSEVPSTTMDSQNCLSDGFFPNSRR